MNCLPNSARSKLPSPIASFPSSLFSIWLYSLGETAAGIDRARVPVRSEF